MFTERTSVGLDVHARSIVGCGLDTVTGQVARRRVTPTLQGVTEWLAELPAPVAVAYEAGPTGFGLARQLTAAGIRCVVAAPSKLQHPPGRAPELSHLLMSAPVRELGRGLRRGVVGRRRCCPTPRCEAG